MIRVKAGFFSFTPPTPPDDDGTYLRWHLLDHQPEQYQLPGIQYALRYVADAQLAQERIAGRGALAEVGNVVHYLIGDPVQQTYDDFVELGARLAEVGRYPDRRPSLEVSMPALLRWYASPRVLISAEVVPFRPHRGVVMIVEEPQGDEVAVATWLDWLHRDHHPELLSAPGVAGVWMYGSTTTWRLRPHTRTGPEYTTMIYLDDDPLTTTRGLRALLEDRWQSGVVRARFAGPLRTMIDWEAWR